MSRFKSRKAESPAAPAWWSEPGPARCDFCLGSFHLEVGYYCADCDRPVCPVCVLEVRERHAVVCPQCNSDEER